MRKNGRWVPSKTQARAFARRMDEDKEYREEYLARKEAKAEKRRSSSKFDYNTAGGSYIPTKSQHDFCLSNIHLFITPEEIDAAHMVVTGFICNEKVHHDYIHIVNTKIRKSDGIQGV